MLLVYDNNKGFIIIIILKNILLYLFINNFFNEI